MPVEGLREPDTLQSDELLRDAIQAAPVRRDHVKAGHRGTAKNQGKFDRVSLTAGHRFTLELSLWGKQDSHPYWQKLLDLLTHTAFRLGGATRRGLGGLKIEHCYAGRFCLGAEDADNGGEELTRLGQLQQSLRTTCESVIQGILLDVTAELHPPANQQYISLHLTPMEEGYRFGGGDTAWRHEEADLKPVTEHRVVWENGTGRLSERRILIPASGIKGALSHRTAYHYNLLSGHFADPEEGESEEAWLARFENTHQNNTAVRELFGYVNEETEEVRPGCLLFDDLYIHRDIQATQLPHSGIDRFTGGVRDNVLFSEELLTHPSTSLPELRITLSQDKENFSPHVIAALERALDDLRDGRLAVGAGSGRGGSGYFHGEWAWQSEQENQNDQ